jgi:hypothetical protein
VRTPDAATEIAASVSECMNACATLTGPAWKDQRDAILDAVSWCVEAAPLIEAPNLEGPKDMIRACAAAAVRLKPAVIAWDGTAEPPPSLVALAREFLACFDLGKVSGP